MLICFCPLGWGGRWTFIRAKHIGSSLCRSYKAIDSPYVQQLYSLSDASTKSTELRGPASVVQSLKSSFARALGPGWSVGPSSDNRNLQVITRLEPAMGFSGMPTRHLPSFHISPWGSCRTSTSSYREILQSPLCDNKNAILVFEIGVNQMLCKHMSCLEDNRVINCPPNPRGERARWDCAVADMMGICFGSMFLYLCQSAEMCRRSCFHYA